MRGSGDEIAPSAALNTTQSLEQQRQGERWSGACEGRRGPTSRAELPWKRRQPAHPLHGRKLGKRDVTFSWSPTTCLENRGPCAGSVSQGLPEKTPLC